MAAKEYASGGRAEPSGSPVDILALHRRAAAGLRGPTADPGAKERAVRAIRALAKGPGAVGPAPRPIPMSVSQMNQCTGYSTAPLWLRISIALAAAVAPISGAPYGAAG